MAESDPKEMDVIRLLKHEIDWLKRKLEIDERVRNANDIKLKLKVRTLEDVNLDLKEKLRVAKKEKKEVFTKSNKIQDDNDGQVAQLDHLWRFRVDMEKELLTMCPSTEVTEQLEKCEEMHKRSIAQLTVTNEADVLKITADFNRRIEEMELIHQKQIEEIVSAHEDEIKQHVSKLNAVEVDNNNKVIELQRKMRIEEVNFNNETEMLRTRYDKLLNDYAEINDKHDVMSERTNELVEMAALKETKRNLMLVGARKETTIRAKKKELWDLTKSEKKLRFSHRKEKNKYAVLKTKLDLDHIAEKAQEHKIKTTLLELEKAEHTKDEALIRNDKLTRIIINLEQKLRSFEPEMKRCMEECRRLKTYQLRFKEGLQKCYDEIGDQKEFKKRFVELKRRYVDDDGPADVLKSDSHRNREETKDKSVFMDKLSTALNKLNSWNKGINTGMKVMTQQSLNEVVKLQKRHSEYINIMNNQTVKIKELKDDLKKATNNGGIHNATSGMMEDILRIPEVDAALKPADVRPPCSERSLSTSRQPPKPRKGAITIHVRPFAMEDQPTTPTLNPPKPLP